MSAKKDVKKALKKLKESIASQVAEAWDSGYSEGYEDGAVEETDVWGNAFQEGANAERERIKKIFDMNIQWALESNKGSDVVFFTKAKQIIEPIEVDLSPEAYQRDLENDGF